MRVAVSNQKGGVGKTTVSINVAGALSDLGREVLFVDLDPQGHATEGVGFPEIYRDEGDHLGDVMKEISGHARVNNLILEGDEFDVLPSNIDMFRLENKLSGSMRSRERLRMVLDAVDADYDDVIIDCPPSLGHLTDNALLATQHVLIPALAEGTSIRALEILWDQVDDLEAGYGVDIDMVGLVANRVESDGEADEMMDWFKSSLGSAMPIWEVRKRVALKRAWAAGVSTFAHEEESGMEPVFHEIAEKIMEEDDE